MSKGKIDDPGASRSYIPYFDVLRIIAALAVVMIHVSAIEWKAAEVTSSDWMAANFFDSLARFAVPVFVMISGALFLGGRQTTGQIWKRSILRVTIAFAFWSAAYAVYHYIKWDDLGHALRELVEGHYHLWYIPMLVGLYALTPLFRKIVESQSLTRYFLVLALVLGFVLPQLADTVSLFSKEWGQSVSQLLGDFHLSVGYVFYYILGYVLSQREIPKKAERLIYLLGGIGLLITLAGTAVASVYAGAAQLLFYEKFSVNVLLYSVALFVFAKEHFRFDLSERAQRVLRRLSKCSFGVYLVHAMILEYSQELTGTLFTPWLWIPLLTFAVFTVSYLISGLLNLIPAVRKYIV
ncbi:MAG: acyltransferase family protein [Clostridia bacterium]|nr:acyltransferase family protein [Clostridia bacterium]